MPQGGMLSVTLRRAEPAQAPADLLHARCG